MLFKYKYIDFNFDFVYNIYTKNETGGENMGKEDKSKETKDSKKSLFSKLVNKLTGNKDSKKQTSTTTASKSKENKNDENKPITNAGKAKELLKSVIVGKSIEEVKDKGFRFDYNDTNLPEKFKKLFGKDGVMDLLADAWMTKDSTSYKTYSFADMRDDLKFCYKCLKFKTYSVNTMLTEEQKEKVKMLEAWLNGYIVTCEKEIENYVKSRKKEKDKHHVIKKATSLLRDAGDFLVGVGTYTLIPAFVGVGSIVKNFSQVIKKLEELSTIIELDMNKSFRKKQLKNMTKIYKEYKSLCEDFEKHNTGKSLVITRYDKQELKNFSETCKKVSKKYKVKINKFKIWSKELSKQKEIVKLGLQNLMDEDTNNDQ